MQQRALAQSLFFTVSPNLTHSLLHPSAFSLASHAPSLPPSISTSPSLPLSPSPSPTTSTPTPTSPMSPMGRFLSRGSSEARTVISSSNPNLPRASSTPSPQLKPELERTAIKKQKPPPPPPNLKRFAPRRRRSIPRRRGGSTTKTSRSPPARASARSSPPPEVSSLRNLSMPLRVSVDGYGVSYCECFQLRRGEAARSLSLKGKLRWMVPCVIRLRFGLFPSVISFCWNYVNLEVFIVVCRLELILRRTLSMWMGIGFPRGNLKRFIWPWTNRKGMLSVMVCEDSFFHKHL